MALNDRYAVAEPSGCLVVVCETESWTDASGPYVSTCPDAPSVLN
jgi:hypothetical protein